LATATLSGVEIATAAINGVENSPGEFQYSLTFNMPVGPTNIASAAGWQDMVTHGGPSGGFYI
jgi:hypothetical protein